MPCLIFSSYTIPLGLSSSVLCPLILPTCISLLLYSVFLTYKVFLHPIRPFLYGFIQTAVSWPFLCSLSSKSYYSLTSDLFFCLVTPRAWPTCPSMISPNTSTYAHANAVPLDSSRLLLCHCSSLFPLHLAGYSQPAELALAMLSLALFDTPFVVLLFNIVVVVLILMDALFFFTNAHTQ